MHYLLSVSLLLSFAVSSSITLASERTEKKKTNPKLALKERETRKPEDFTMKITDGVPYVSYKDQASKPLSEVVDLSSSLGMALIAKFNTQFKVSKLSEVGSQDVTLNLTIQHTKQENKQ